MCVTCLSENLKHGLAIVGHAVAGKNTLPILSNVLPSTEDDRLTLAATNLEIGITRAIGAQIDGAKAVTIPAKLLADIVKDQPDDRIDLPLDKRTQTLHLRCARFECNLKGIEVDEFPAIPTNRPRRVSTRRASFPPRLLREIIDQIAFAAATDDTRPALAGVLMRIRGATATFAAAGFQCSVRTVERAEPLDEPLEGVIPARAFSSSGASSATSRTKWRSP